MRAGQLARYRADECSRFIYLCVIFINLPPETVNTEYIEDDWVVCSVHCSRIYPIPVFQQQAPEWRLKFIFGQKWIVLANEANGRDTHSYQKMAHTILALR